MTQTQNIFEVAIATRKSNEVAKAPNCTSMCATLDNLAKSVAHQKIVDVMLAAQVDANFINRAERSNAYYNVYAAEKVVNIARFLAVVAALNHYTKFIFLSALALEKNDMTLTHKDAACACSKDAKHADAKRSKHIVRYEKIVSPSTASTQSSSSINALQTFGILTESRDAANVVIYRINRENETTKALAKALSVKL